MGPSGQTGQEAGGIVDFEDEVTDYQGTAGEPLRRASLYVELRMPDRDVLFGFRDAFLNWLSGRQSLFSGIGDASARLSLDEVSPRPDAQGMATLRLSLSWPLDRSSVADAPRPELQGSGEPTRGSASLTPVDHFVFFPDAADSAPPMYSQLPTALHVEAFGTAAQPARRKRRGAAGLVLLGRLIGAAQAARTSIRQRASALGSGGLTLRSPMRARYRRAWRFGLLGAAAVAAGFVAGSIYLASVDPPRTSSMTPPLPAGEPAGPRDPAALVESTESRVAAASRPPVESPPDRARALEDRTLPAPVPPADRAAQIPDTEVTTRRGRQNSPGRAVPLNSPSVVAVREVENDAASTTPRQQGKGSLLVRSDPQGAQVSVNGIVQGRTPLVVRDLDAGSRVVRVELPGYQRWSWAVAIAAERQTPVTVKLQPESRAGSRND
jgi:hypothetical protein